MLNIDILIRNGGVWRCMEAYILSIDCLLIALDAHMFSHNGYGPGTKGQGAVGQDLGDPTPWALDLGPGPISIMAAHMCIKGNQ